MKMIDKERSKKLTDEIVRYITSRQDKKEESFLKDKPNRNRNREITNGAINSRLLNVAKRLVTDNQTISAIEKSKKTNEQTNLEFQKCRFDRLLLLIGEGVIDVELNDIINVYQEFSLVNKKNHDPVTWLTQWALKAEDISFATHVGKLTHSSSKSSSILDMSVELNDKYLTTNSLNNAEVDTASSNAASLPIADILKLAVSGVSVLNCLKNDDKAIFRNLSNNEVLIEEWCKLLKQAYDSTQKQSYFLSKQTYFPVNDHQYHLLLPLTSSSLVHELHLEHKKYWDEEQTVARDQKSKKKYSSTATRSYANKAYLHVTGSNHSNASSLNGKRGGRISLLPNSPPQWHSNQLTFINKSDIFDKRLGLELKNEINDLKKYLLLIKNKSLSISEPKRNAAVMNKLQSISSLFFNFVEEINGNAAKPNWTSESSLPQEQQLLFEPWREDEAANSVKISKQWKMTLSRSYGRWLNKQLNQKNKLVLSALHEALWADAFLIELREFIAIQEVSL